MQHNNNLLFRILMLFRNKILISEKKKKKKRKRDTFAYPSFFLNSTRNSLSKFFVDTCLRNHVHPTWRRIDTLITLELELECHFNSSFATVSRKPPNDPVTYYQASDSNSVSTEIPTPFDIPSSTSSPFRNVASSCMRNFIHRYDRKYLEENLIKNMRVFLSTFDNHQR